jgi:hypothetical protein
LKFKGINPQKADKEEAVFLAEENLILKERKDT